MNGCAIMMLVGNFVDFVDDDGVSASAIVSSKI